MTITIYHNTACGTSRNTLALIRNTGVEPVIIDYVKHPPSREELVDLIERAGLSVRAVMRDKGALYDELGLANPQLSDAARAFPEWPRLRRCAGCGPCVADDG